MKVLTHRPIDVKATTWAGLPPKKVRGLRQKVRSCRGIAAMAPWTGFVDLIILAPLGLTRSPGGAAIVPLCAVCLERVSEHYDS